MPPSPLQDTGSTPKHIVIIGAGPGGLTTAMLLANRGFKVTLLEKENAVGGRNTAIRQGGYTFDTGPTFLMMKFILDEVFEEAGCAVDDYLEFSKLEPMYRLQFEDLRMEPTTDREVMLAQLEEKFPGSSAGYGLFMEKEKQRFDAMYPCLQKDYSSLLEYLSLDLLKALPHLALGRSLLDVLGDYFKEERLQLSFTFQAKYLGMSAWECPGAFAILPYVEHAHGIYHVTGGLSVISDAMAKVAREKGVDIRLNTPVRELLMDGRKVRGVELENGGQILADEVVINADFAHAMNHIVPKGFLKKYSPNGLEKKEYSCSTFMLYLGLDKVYDLPHHTIFFASNYKDNIADIFQHKRLSQDVSFYVRNASITDATLAPAGHSAIYVLVPVPNNSSDIDWGKEKAAYRNLVIQSMEQRACMSGLSEHICEEIVYTPDTWEASGIYLGATFNLSHCLSQMLYFRPHNKFEELDHCYLVGGGTHPGSGLPTIYESGRIAANLICRAHGIPFVSKNVKT